jgi:hypothetical protein
MPMGETGQSFDNQIGIEENINDFALAADGDEWLYGWGYRKKHLISGQVGVSTNYQMKFHVEYNTEPSFEGTVNCHANCRTDFGDIRFTGSSGGIGEKLDYWMEEKTNSDDATFWVEVQDSLGTDRVIYIYYGNADETTESDGSATFLFFDDFDDASLNTSKWEEWYTGGSYSESGGLLQITGGATLYEIVGSKSQWQGGVNIMMRAKSDEVAYTAIGLDERSDGGGVEGQTLDQFKVYNDGNKKWRYSDDGDDATMDARADAITSYTVIEFRWVSSVNIKVYFNSALKKTLTTEAPDDYCGIEFEAKGSTSDVFADWVAVRTFLGAEPQHSTWWGQEDEPNHDPTNDGTPTISNADDGNNLYARYRKYEVTTYLKDFNGFADIDYTEFSVYGNDRVTCYFYGRFVQNTHVFSEQGTTDQKNRWELDTAGSTYSEHDTYELDVTWKFYVEWACADLVTIDVRSSVWDSAEVTTNYYEVDWDIDTDLTTTFTLNDGSGTVDHGNYNSIDSITAGGTVSYEDSGGNNYPTTAEVDMYIRCAAVAGSDWYDTTLSSGVWSVTVDSDDVIGLDTYYVKAVQAGGNYDSATLLGATTSDTYIADRVRVVSYTIVSPAGDNRNNIGTTYTIDVELHYDLYETDVVDGTVTVNGESMDSYQGSGKWRWTPTQAGVTGITYNNVQVTGNAKGITVEDNTVTQLIIWDRVQVQSYTITDDWVNINDNVNIDFLVWYDYDNAQVTDGDFTLNGYDAAYQGSGVWRITRTSASPAMVNYNTVLVSATNTHGIDVEDQNGKSRQVVWDSVTITMTDPTDQRQNLNANATGIHITITMDYNGTAYGGTATMNNTDYNGDGTVVRWGYTVSSVSGGTEDITTISSNDETYMIWDSLTITITGPTDNRINIGANASGIHMSAIRDYDSTAFTGTLTLNDTTYDHGSVGIYYYTVQTASGGADGITTISSNDDIYCIFDRIKILTTSATTNYIEYGTESTTVNVTAELEYDSHALGSGDTLYMNDTLMTWDTDHFYIVFGPYDVFGSWSLFVNSSSANEVTYGITTIWLNGQSDTVATDRVKVISYAISDARDNINDYIWINVTVQYESDSSTITDGTIVINGYSFSHLGSGVWRHNRTQANVVGITFNSVVASGNTRGITVVNQNGQNQTAVWDSLTITITGPTDNRQNINANASGIGITVIYDYDGASFDGTFTMNNTDYNGDGTVIRWGYTISSVSGDTYGITVISSNDETYMIWDSLTITITGPTDQRIDINENATGISASAIRDYDSSVFDGTFTFNNTDYNGDGTVVRWGYTVSSATGGTYGITTINSNDETYEIWDRVEITLSTNMTWTVIGYYINVSYIAIYEYDSTSYSGTYTWNNGVGEITKNTVANYTWYPTSIADANYQLTGFSNNTVYCIFDDIVLNPTGHWVQEDEYTAFYRMELTTFQWDFNDTLVQNSPQIKVQSQLNETNDDWGVIKDTDMLSMILLIGSVDYDWYWANITLYAQFSGYNWSIHSLFTEVDILHSIHFAVFRIHETDDYVVFEYYTEHDNATWVSVYDNITGTPTRIYNHTDEGSHRILLSEVEGTHLLIFLFNQTTGLSWDEQSYNTSLTDDWWAWNDYRYIVVESPIVLTVYTLIGASSDFDYMHYSFHITHDCTFIIEEWSDTWAKNETHSGSVYEGDDAVAWDKIGVNDINANYTITFTNGSLTLVVDGYYITAYKELRITEIDFINIEQSDSWTTNLTINFNANKAVDWYIYDRDDSDAVLGSGSATEGDGFMTWVQNTARGAHNFAVKWTDGISNEWYNGSYWVYDKNIDELPGGGDPGVDQRRTIEFWATVAGIISVIGLLVVGGVYVGLKDEMKQLQLPHYDTQDTGRRGRR